MSNYNLGAIYSSVPNCLFAFWVPNCPFLLNWCQIVRCQIVLPPPKFPGAWVPVGWIRGGPNLRWPKVSWPKFTPPTEDKSEIENRDRTGITIEYVSCWAKYCKLMHEIKNTCHIFGPQKGHFWQSGPRHGLFSGQTTTYWKTKGIQSYLRIWGTYDPIESGLSEPKNGGFIGVA